MHTIPRTLFSDRHTWAANTTTKTDLPRNARLQRLILFLTANITVTAASAKNDDGLHNLVKAIRVRRNGSDPIFNLPAKYVHYLNYVDYETRPEFNDTPTGATAAADYTAMYVVDFRQNPKNPTDPYGALNAVDASQLTLEIDWGAASDIGTNVTVNSANILVTQIELFMSQAEQDAVYGRKLPDGRREKDLLKYRSFVQKTIDAAYGSYQFPVDLPAGNILERCFAFVRRAGARDDTQVTSFKIKQQSPTPLDLMEYDWASSQMHDRLDFQAPAAVDGSRIAKGLTVIDFSDQGHLNLRSAKKGDVQLLATTIAPSGTTDLTLVNEEWAPAKA